MLSLLRKNIIQCSSFIKKMNENMNSLHRAQRVQQNTLEQNYTIQMQAKLRNKLDIDSQIDSLQKQMNQQIARSLKKSEDKINFFIQKTQKSYQQLYKLSQNDKIKRYKEIKQYNDLVQLCLKFRWQFLVHRQSCGFTIQNYQIVHSLYQVPPKIL